MRRAPWVDAPTDTRSSFNELQSFSAHVSSGMLQSLQTQKVPVLLSKHDRQNGVPLETLLCPTLIACFACVVRNLKSLFQRGFCNFAAAQSRVDYCEVVYDLFALLNGDFIRLTHYTIARPSRDLCVHLSSQPPLLFKFPEWLLGGSPLLMCK